MIGPKPRIVLLAGGQPQAWADPVVGNAMHSGGGLTITIYKNLPDFTGTLAQEYYEIEKERVQGLIGTLPGIAIATGALLCGTAAIELILAGAGFAGIVLGARLGAAYAPEAHEVRSHALTALVMVKYDGFAVADAELACANSMSQRGYSWAHGETNDALIARMRADYPNVQPWIDANAALLASWQALRGPPIGPQ